MSAAPLSRRASTFRQLIGDGFAWWLGELRDMVPLGLSRRLVGARNRGAVLEIGRERASLLIKPAGTQAATSIPLTEEDSGELRARVRSALRAASFGRTVAIRLDPGLVLESDLELPAAAERSLRQIVRNQLAKLTPLDAASVCFAYRVVERLPAAKLLKLRVFIAKQTTIDRALALANGVGLDPSMVTASAVGPTVRPGAPLVLWQAGKSASAVSHQRQWLRVLETATIVLLMVTYGLHIYRLDRARADLRAAVAEARQMAAGTQLVATQIKQMQEALDSFAARRGGAPPLRILDELTRLVPQDSWVFQLSLHAHAVEITGYSPRATDMISRVEGSALFEKPKFRSPITLAPDGNTEQFSLSFDVRQVPAP